MDLAYNRYFHNVYYRRGPRKRYHCPPAPIGLKQAVRAAVGAAHPHINLSDIKSYLIPTPPIAKQKRIAKEANGIKSQTQRLESTYRQKLAALEALKKSLLHEAFRGQL